MTLEIREPGLEQSMREALQSGRFQNMDDLLTQALRALREKPQVDPASPPVREPKKNFARFLLDSPLHGSGLTIERQKDYPRPVHL